MDRSFRAQQVQVRTIVPANGTLVTFFSVCFLFPVFAFSLAAEQYLNDESRAQMRCHVLILLLCVAIITQHRPSTQKQTYHI